MLSNILTQNNNVHQSKRSTNLHLSMHDGSSDSIKGVTGFQLIVFLALYPTVCFCLTLQHWFKTPMNPLYSCSSSNDRDKVVN